MTNLLNRIEEILRNLNVVRRESKLVDELMKLTLSAGTPEETLRELAGRLRAVADAKDGDWVTKTFTHSTAAELRSLAAAYESMANEATIRGEER